VNIFQNPIYIITGNAGNGKYEVEAKFGDTLMSVLGAWGAVLKRRTIKNATNKGSVTQCNNNMRKSLLPMW